MLRRNKKPPPRCQYGHWWDNELTGQKAYIQCGGAGTSRAQMCSEAEEHPSMPDKLDESTGWPVLERGWTVEKIWPLEPRRS